MGKLEYRGLENSDRWTFVTRRDKNYEVLYEDDYEDEPGGVVFEVCVGLRNEGKYRDICSYHSLIKFDHDVPGNDQNAEHCFINKVPVVHLKEHDRSHLLQTIDTWYSFISRLHKVDKALGSSAVRPVSSKILDVIITDSFYRLQ